MYKEILFKKENKIATITFNRPEFANAFGDYSIEEVIDAINLCGKDDDVRAVVITGAGKMFSAGGDIQKFKKNLDVNKFLEVDWVKNFGNMTMAIRRCPKPVIAMINGSAAGGGLALALSCDFRVMTEKSKLVTAYIDLGFCGDMGVIKYMQALIGLERTSELLMLSKPLTAQKALEYGLCSRVAEVDKLEEVTMELANDLASKSPLAIAKQKSIINEFFYGELEELITREAQYMAELSRTKDHKEAVDAFLEKRKPVFNGN